MPRNRWVYAQKTGGYDQKTDGYAQKQVDIPLETDGNDQKTGSIRGNRQIGLETGEYAQKTDGYSQKQADMPLEIDGYMPRKQMDMPRKQFETKVRSEGDSLCAQHD